MKNRNIRSPAVQRVANWLPIRTAVVVIAFVADVVKEVVVYLHLVMSTRIASAGGAHRANLAPASRRAASTAIGARKSQNHCSGNAVMCHVSEHRKIADRGPGLRLIKWCNPSGVGRRALRGQVKRDPTRILRCRHPGI